MITSTNNTSVKKIIALLEKAKTRKEEQCFVVEGLKMVLEMPLEQRKSCYLSESFSKNLNEELRQQLSGFEIDILSDQVFKKVSNTMTPQGILAVAKMKSNDLEGYLQQDNGLYMVLDTLQDPGNAGTIIRTAEGAGVNAIILNRSSVDIYNPKVVRSTMGSIYRMPCFYVDDLKATLLQMKDQGIQLYAAHLEGKHNYYESNYKRSSAFLIGNEAKGLSQEIAVLANEYIKIPMAGQVESLNASVAAALLMYEAKRQRDL